MKPTPYDHYWENAENWHWKLFYACRNDPRIIVPKKPAWAGRTLNFAHRKSYLVLLITVIVTVAPLALLGQINGFLWSILYAAIIAGVIVYYYRANLYAKNGPPFHVN